MSLRQKDEKLRQFLDQQIAAVNLDMSILNGISKQNKVIEKVSIQKTANLSLNELAQVLKNKNDKYTHLKLEKQEAKEWLKEKGVNLRKLNEEVAENARVSVELGIFLEPKRVSAKPMDISTLNRESLTRHLEGQKAYVFTADSQSQFINKQKNVALNRGIINSMQKSRPRNHFRNTLLEKIKQSLINDQDQNKSPQHNKKMYPEQRDEEELALETRKNQYFDFVESLNKQVVIENFQKLKSVKSFWKIVFNHLKTIEFYAPKLANLKDSYFDDFPIDRAQLRLNATLMYKSLKTIEFEFSKSLPNTINSYEKLDEMIKDMERRNRKLKVQRNSNAEPSWARAFILLRAGRKDEAKRVLENVDKDLLEDILKHEDSLATKPEPSFKKHDPLKYKDSFYNQLLYILEAKQKFDPQIIGNEYLTKFWILLRTIGIYRQKPQMQVTYKKLGDAILKSETQSPSLYLENAENFLYLGLYEELIFLVEMILEKEISKELRDFNYDDYFHLLTVIHIYPELWGNTSPKQKAGLEAKFIKTLKVYIKKLKIDGFIKETPKYILLCPPKKIKQVLCEFITTQDDYQKFDWESLKYLLKQRNPENAASIYMDLSKSVLDSIQLKTFKDFIFAANHYRSTFSSINNSIYLEQKCYVKFLIKYLYFVEKKKYLVIKNALRQEFTDEMFKFFQISLQEASSEEKLQKKDEQVKKRVSQCERFLQNHIDWDAISPLYIQNVLRPFLFYQKFSELGNLLQDPFQKFISLKNFDHNQIYKELKSKLKLLEHTQHLLQFFSSELDNEVTSLYIFYLNSLIERKKILSTKECDYSGLSSYIENILQGLQILDSSYQEKAQEFDQKEGKFMDEREREKQAEKYQNHLKLCDEYEGFVKELQEYLGKYGGVYGLEFGNFAQGSLSNDRRTEGVRRQNFGTGIVF